LLCGKVTLRPDGSFTYTPAPGFRGVDYFFYHATGRVETSAPVAVRINVGQPPVGVTDTYRVPMNTGNQPPFSVGAPGILANDVFDTAGSASVRRFALLVSGPAFGKLTFNANGSFSYRPNPGFTGTDYFTYVPSTGMLGTGGELQGNPTTVILNVR
jgi:hypothetical protein